MHLARLEMIGFKSFPEKIRLEFDKGITAVVGPNGSGKSNISDAIRWVLGEQSAKSLRGAKMEDVIFAGTANRKPLGYAEVTMVIDNRDSGLKIDYDEVSVTRRVYRSGDSEYSINGTTCRLKDIHELFMDTGIGKEGYSIIGQGKIEEVLASKGEERRLLLEEAAGIVKYKARRFEALGKLEKERASLLRVQDIMEEIEQGLPNLLEQSEKAKKYLRLAEGLKLVQINIFTSEVESAQSKIDKIDENMQIVAEQISDTENRHNEYENKINKLEDSVKIFEEDILNLSAQMADTRSCCEQSENDIILKEEQIKHINSDIENFKARIEEKENFLEQDISEINGLEIQLQVFNKELDEKTVFLDEKSKELSGFSDIMSEEEQEVQALNNTVYQLMNDINGIDNNLSRLETSYEQLENLMEQTSEEAVLVNEQLSTLEAEIEQESIIISECSDKIGSQNKNLLQLSSEKEGLSLELSENKSLLKACSLKLSEVEYKNKILNELEASHEGYAAAVKSILSKKNESPDEFGGVIGAVGELVSVEKKLETALEIALGSSVQHIVTNTENAAKKAIDYLKKSKAGRATFIPLTTIKPRNSYVDKMLLKEKGVLGTAFELCVFDKRYNDVFSSLLSNTVIVDTLDNAVNLSKKYNYSNRLVTLEGELFSPGGSITGGSLSRRASGIFSRKRELTELIYKKDTLAEEEKMLSDTINRIKKQLDVIDSQKDNITNELQSLQIQFSTSSERLNQLKNTLIINKEKIKNLNLEESKLMNQIVELNKNLREVALSKKSKENEIIAAKEKEALLNEAIVAKRMEKDSKYSELTDLNVHIASLGEKIANVAAQMETLKSRINAENNAVNGLESDIKLKAAALYEKKQEVNKLSLTKAEQLELSAQLYLKNEQLQTDFLSVKEEQKELAEGKLDLLDQLSILRNEKLKLEIQKEHVDEDLRKIYDHMWNEYELTYNGAKGYQKLEKPLNKLVSEERQLKNDIRLLGDINIGAIDEYKTASERLAFFTAQASDITQAEEKLKGLISQLTKMMESQFRELFSVISDNFQTIFRDIFGGGTAYLQLSDEENLLEASIEIIAKPPGKALQNLSLLSGGERALTATALLFAILRLKPSPFCILDEIESALDDANAIRYINYLRKLREDTQFILITHRKSVMEAADVLYGITMQEQGVSALVSVKFEGESA